MNCHNTAALINKGQYVGGIVGFGGGTIIACSNSGAITNNETNSFTGGIAGTNDRIIIGCFNTASIVGNNQVGGIVGSCREITTCWSAANTITATGDRANKGGIAASPQKAKYCYWKAIDGISGTSTGNVENCEAFSGDTPSADQIKAMNDAWQAADADREYQFNATTGMIEKKP